MVLRLRHAAMLALITSVWCWLLTALHGVWSFGIVLGYLDGGRVPLYPNWSVTYWGFFMDAIGAFAVPFLLILTVCSVLPKYTHLPVLLTAWMLGAFIGASNTVFIYQIDFGATWAPLEALRALYVHPIVTPFCILFGLAGTVSLTRPQRG
ncbi:MAG: hypothetical protein KIH44_006640 [Octadecabacter sp.]|nr:hypothetical protein [Octadecabacter sp.]